MKMKWKFILEFLEFFSEILFYFLKFWRKLGIFNTNFVSYSVSLQPDIMQNS